MNEPQCVDIEFHGYVKYDIHPAEAIVTKFASKGTFNINKCRVRLTPTCPVVEVTVAGNKGFTISYPPKVSF